MSYEKTVWTKGDIITSEKLNKMEDGIAAAESSGGSDGGSLFCTLENDVLDHTVQEIIDAFISGKSVVVHCVAYDPEYLENIYETIGSMYYSPGDNKYFIWGSHFGYEAENVTDYPHITS